MKDVMMDSSLAAFLFAFVYGPNTWLFAQIWNGVDNKLFDGLENARLMWAQQHAPIACIFKCPVERSRAETSLHDCLNNYFSGAATITLSRPFHLMLSAPLLVWSVLTVQSSKMWTQGTLPIDDFKTIFAVALAWLLVSVAIFLLQYWGLRKVEKSKPNALGDF